MRTIDFWHVAFTLFFIVLVWIGSSLVASRIASLWSITVWETAILALAAFRLTRFLVYDSITQWFRDLFAGAAPRTFAHTVHTLVNCAWCTGLWAALVVATVYFAFPAWWFFVYVLALGGIASFVQIVANLVGWNAEFKKRATLGAGETHYGSKCG